MFSINLNTCSACVLFSKKNTVLLFSEHACVLVEQGHMSPVEQVHMCAC